MLNRYLIRVANDQPLWSRYLSRRTFAADTAIQKTSSSSSGPGRVSSFVQRITSFFIGAGLTALGTQYYLYEEIKQGNKELISKHKELETKIATLEKKLS